MWNVLFIIPIISTVISIILNIYLYLENRKLRGFEIEKNIKLKEIEIKELNERYEKEKEELPEKLQSEGRLNSGFKNAGENKLKQKYENKKTKLNAELKYLKKAEKI